MRARVTVEIRAKGRGTVLGRHIMVAGGSLAEHSRNVPATAVVLDFPHTGESPHYVYVQGKGTEWYVVAGFDGQALAINPQDGYPSVYLALCECVKGCTQPDRCGHPDDLSPMAQSIADDLAARLDKVVVLMPPEG